MERNSPLTDQARILVVEDNALNMELFAILLEDAGHAVIMAQSGRNRPRYER